VALCRAVLHPVVDERAVLVPEAQRLGELGYFALQGIMVGGDTPKTCEI
jgi:hypothetical protein